MSFYYQQREHQFIGGLLFGAKSIISFSKESITPKFADILIAVGKRISAKAMLYALLVEANVFIAIGVVITPLAML